MDTTHRLTSATTESGAPESLHGSTQGLILSPHVSGPSSETRGRMTEGRVQPQRKRTSLREHAAALMQPPMKVGPPPTVWQSIRAILLVSCELSSSTEQILDVQWFLVRSECASHLYSNICTFLFIGLRRVYADIRRVSVH